jgi:predicted dehydrogenase
MFTNRRAFLAAAAAASATKLSAQDKPTYGLIGAGGRGRYLSRYFNQLGAQCVAVCDVYEPNIAEALKLNPDAKRYINHDELLQQKGIDFTVNAGPDHWHMPHLLDAIKAGKDVYTEKPLARTLAEGAQVVKAVKASNKIVQVGMQRRSAPSLHEAKKIIDEGKLGRITMAKAQWNWNVSRPLNNKPLEGELHWNRFLGKAQQRPVEPMRWRSWRVFKDYAGGNMTDQGTHLMDVILWFTGKGVPKSAVAQGYIAKMTGAEHPDVFSAVFDHGDMMTTWTLDYANAFENGWSILFMGDEGTMRLDDAGVVVWKEPWHQNQTPVVEMKAPVPIEPHIQNFLDCIKSRKQPNCTVDLAQSAVAGPHLANIAMFEGRKAKLAADLMTVS